MAIDKNQKGQMKIMNLVQAIGKLLSTIMVICLKFYRFFISLLLGPCCRFEPNCSTYAIKAIKLHGCFKGGCLTLRRLMRCHPWHPGGIDQVP